MRAFLWQATSDEEEWRQKQARAQAEYGPRKEKFDEAKEKVLRLKKEGEEKQEEASAFEGPQRRLTSDQRKAAKELEKAQGDGEAKRADARKIQVYLAKFAPLVEEQYGERVDDPEARSVEQLKQGPPPIPIPRPPKPRN